MEIFNPDTNINVNKSAPRAMSTSTAVPTHETHSTPQLRSKTVCCPYCQEKFDINDVLFRADLAVPNTSGDDFFTAKADSVFSHHWQNEMNWGNSTEIREFEYDYSITAKDSKDGTPISQVKFCILDNAHISEISHENGFIVSAVDTRGVATDKRVCPHCHSLLPLNYGMNDIHFISIVGIRGSGKTVFLSKLFEQMDDYLVGTGFYTLPTDTLERFLKTKRLVPGTPVPEGTQPNRINPPIFMDINDQAQNTRTLVFYDIAGEDCDEAADLRRVGTFIGNSDGTIMLVSPGQFGALENIKDDATVDGTNIYSVYNAIAGAFGVNAAREARDNNLFGKILRFFKRDLAATAETPLAIVVSKSDMLIDATINGQPVFTGDVKDISVFNNNNYPENHSGYMVEEGNQVESLVRRRLFDPLRFNARVANIYGNTHYFAVSVFGKSPDMREMKDNKGNPIYQLDEQTGKPKLDADGKPIIQMEKLVPQHPNTLRLEEPIFWILSRLGIINNI